MSNHQEVKYKLVAFDIDGTLVDDQKRLLPSTINSVIAIQQMGIKVVLATGRPTFGTREIAKRLRLDEFGGYLLTYNGGKLTSCADGKILARRTIPKEQLTYVYELVKEHSGLSLMGYNNQRIITETPDNPFVLSESRVDGDMPVQKVDHLLDAMTQDPLKLAIVGETTALYQAKEDLEAHYGRSLNFFISNDHFLDVVPRGVDKGSTLEFLVEELGMDKSEVMAVGDSYNDLSMITIAGLGVAMSNATEAVKRSADYVTTGNNTDGISHLLNKFILHPEASNADRLDVELLNQMIEGHTLMSTLGIKCIKLEEGYVECTMPVDNRTQQPMGILHGGASLALAETVAGYGSIVLLKENEIQVGMQVSGNHVSSAHSGDTVRAVGTIVHKGRSTHVWNVDVLSERGKLICTVRVINSILNKR
ncbi:MAG: Cof-type HAD-IIB family hydrolase [Porphyromonas sp.]|nr:Cof-type HAD-IIB family hydrolase [Porphyromonas sp.]